MRFFSTAVAAAIAFTGASALPAQAPTPEQMRQAYDQSFRATFRSEAISQCVKSGADFASAGYDITPACTCVADTMLRTQTIAQLNELSKVGSSPALQNAAEQCMASNPPRPFKR